MDTRDETRDTANEADDLKPAEAIGAAPRSIRNQSELLAAIESFIQRNPEVLGGGDIITVTGGKPVVRAGIITAVLTGVRLEGGEPAILKYVIIVPASANVSDAHALAWGGFVSSFERLARRKLEGDEEAWFRARFEVRKASDGRIASVVALIGEQPERTAVIVIEAAAYRDDAVAPFVPDGAQTPLAPEDVWVPQLHALADAAVSAAREKNLYVAIDANELTPIRPDLEALLRSIERCGVMGGTDDAGAETIVAHRVVEWDRWIASGHVGLALRDVDAQPAAVDTHKAYLRVQLLHKAGLHVEALAAIRSEFLARPVGDPSTRVRLARIAEDAGASLLARELLEPCIDELEGREDLESALQTLESAGGDAAEQRVAERLEARFPGAEGVKRHHRRRLARERDFAGVANLIRASDPEDAAFYDALASAFSGAGVPDYFGLIESADDTAKAESFRLACVDDALARGLTVHAFELAVTPPSNEGLSGRWERRLLDALKRCLLDLDVDGNPPVAMQRLLDAVRELAARLADNPSNGVLRVGLVDILRPEIAGSVGLALGAKLVLDLASEPIALTKGFQFTAASLDWLTEHEPFLLRAFEWLESEQPIVIGLLALPAELMTEDPDEAISAIASYLEKAPVGDDSDINALRLFLTLAAAIAPHSVDPDVDMRLYRLLSGKLVSAGFPQHGRDLVEAAMQAGRTTPRRRRMAWFAVADVYHRAHDHITGLLALACAFLADDSADEEELWQEIYGMARLMRDTGLTPIALMAVNKGRELLARMKLLKTYGHRLDLLEVQLRQTQLAANDLAELEALLHEMVRIGREVLKRGDQTAPSGIALGQLIRVARGAGVVVPDDADEVFAELNKWAGGKLAAMVAAASASTPTIDQLEHLVTTIPAARYADDVGYDTNVVAMLARRALTDDKVLASSGDTSFALEVQADWGTALPHWDERASPPPVLGRAEPEAIAKATSLEGVSVLQIGFDDNGRLVHSLTVDGNSGAVTCEPPELFSERPFREWSREFPYSYGYDERPNLFYTTTEQLRLSVLPDAPTIISAATELQAFPPNILRDADDFLGRRQPVATVPSLAWLRGARADNWIGDGRLLAWISAAESEEGRVTLSLLARRLEVPFTDFGFTVDTGPVIPRNFAGSTLAVLTAHGGVHPEGKFFQVVSDEGVLKVAAADLAAALRNVGVVVLFICSGGRADKHPVANTTLGLAKQILDRGCSAVIASPWPLDSQVPPNWLPAFLDHWSRGTTLMEAAYAANQIVDNRFSLDPARGLAMTVYGNPFLKLPSEVGAES